MTRLAAALVFLALLHATTSPAADRLAAASGAATARAQPETSSIVETVRQMVARYFGVPVEQVTPGTDLLRDIKADPVDAVELVALICERWKVPPPTSGELTTVQAIVDHIEDKLAERPRGAVGPKPPEPGPIHVQKVLFATDREPTGSSEIEDLFDGRRAREGKVTYGVSEVTIPVAVHERGQEERPSLFRLEMAEDPQKHIVIRSVTPLAAERFMAELATMARGADGDALVFIHGFNVTFAKAVRRTAQIAYDLDYRGVPLMYSWPSDGRLLSYLSDREDVEWSVPHIQRFLLDIAALGEVRRLHLIAHSMGNQGLLRALHEIAASRGRDQPPLFENVILAAPDFDAQVFTEQLAPAIAGLARRWTVYSSDKDSALNASAVLSVQRLGSPLAVARGIDTIDASGIDVTPWSVPEFHSYYSSKRRVIADLIAVLRGLAPGDRDLVRLSRENLPYWQLKPN